MRKHRNYIDGGWEASASEDSLTLVNPSTEEAIGWLPGGSADDVDRAVRAAERASSLWSSEPLETRLAILEAAADILASSVSELAQIEETEMGRPQQTGEAWIAPAVDALRSNI